MKKQLTNNERRTADGGRQTYNKRKENDNSQKYQTQTPS